MTFDMNNVPDPNTDLIPEGQAVWGKLVLVPGFGTPIADATMSRTSNAIYGKFRIDVIGPVPFGGSTLWDNVGLVAKDGSEDSFYAKNGKSRLRHYADSACGLEHHDLSQEAMDLRAKFRELNDWHGKTVMLIVNHRTDNQGVKRMEAGQILSGEDPEYQSMAEAAGLPRQPYLGGDSIPNG
jgi:hypothetical protein